MTGTYTWIGGTTGAWSDPAAWDVAGGPPGLLDRASLFAMTDRFAVTGPGSAAFADTTGGGTLAGTFTFGSLHVGDSGGPLRQEVLLTGGIESIGTLQTFGSLVITQATANVESVILGGPPALGPDVPYGPIGHVGQSGWLTLRDHGTLVAAAIDVHVGMSDQTVLRMDATSRAEIGSAGTGAVGTLTVDADGRILGGVGTIVAPELLNLGTVAVGVIDGTVLNRGTLSGVVSAGTNDGVMSGVLSHVVNNGTIHDASIDHITGPGTILVGSALELGQGNVGTIFFNQADGRVVAYGAHAFDGVVLAGFRSSTSLEMRGVDATAAQWGTIGGGLGTIALSRAGSVVATVTVAGTYDGAVFTALPDPFSPYGTALYLADGAFGAGTVAPSPGLATTDPITWTGGSGAWGDATHWRDAFTQEMVSAAPGVGNDVTIQANTQAQVLSGQGQAGKLSLFGQMILSGIVEAGTLMVGRPSGWGAAVVWQGATLDVGTAQIGEGGLWANGGLVAFGGGVTIDASQPDPDMGLPVPGTLAAVDGGTIQALGPVSILSGIVTVDARSILEIGSAHDGVAGTLTVDADGWVGAAQSGTGTLVGGTILNAGTIASLALQGTVVNHGLLQQVTAATVSNLGVMQGATATTVQNGGTIVDGWIGHLTGTGAVDVSSYMRLGSTDGARVDFLDDSATLVLTDADHAPVIGGFVQGDIIALSDVVATGVTYVATGPDGGTLVFLNGDTTSATLTLAGDYTGHSFFLGENSTIVTLDVPLPPPPPLPCFVTGTLIRTRRGDVPVEELRLGDEVATCLPLGFRPIRWIGQRSVRPAAHPDPAAVRPIRVRAGAFGRALPRRDLLLSPDHALYLEGVLIPVKLLVDGAAIAPVDLPEVTYWHVELDQHDVLLAEGLPAESYLDAGDRHAFGNGPVVALHPRFGWLAHDAEGCAPLVVTGRILDRLRAQLGRRAARKQARLSH